MERPLDDRRQLEQDLPAVKLVDLVPGLETTLRQIAEGLSAFLQREDVREFTRKFVEFAIRFPEIQARIERQPADLRAAFQAAGYPPCRWGTMEDMGRIQAAHMAGDQPLTVSLVEGLCRSAVFDPDGRATIWRSWESNAVLGKRLAILREALDAVVQGLHAVAIPTLIAQTEGIIADGAGHQGMMGGRQYLSRVRTLASSEEYLGARLLEFVDTELLVEFQHGSPLRSDFSRHAILHGADTSYPSERNAVRAVILVDYVQDLVRPKTRDE